MPEVQTRLPSSDGLVYEMAELALEDSLQGCEHFRD